MMLQLGGGMHAKIPSVEIVRLSTHSTAPKPLFKATKGRNVGTTGFATRYLRELCRNNALGAGRNYRNEGANDAAERESTGVLDRVGLWDDGQGERCHARQRGCSHGDREQASQVNLSWNAFVLRTSGCTAFTCCNQQNTQQ